MPILESMVEYLPNFPVWRLTIAAVLVDADRVDEARPHFHYLADDGCANVPADPLYPVTMCGLGLISYAVMPTKGVLQSIYDPLLPFEGTFNFSGVTITEPNGLGLAMAAAALGEHDLADRHFAGAVALCERAGARPFLAGAISTGRGSATIAVTPRAPVNTRSPPWRSVPRSG